MKAAENASGAQLSTMAAKIAPGYFVLALTVADAERNMEMLKERGWFDVPIVYEDGHRAILALEKGSAGDRVFSEAFAAWSERH